MNITDELCSLTKDPLLGYASQNQHIERLTAIADHIDAAYEEALGNKVTGALLANEDGTEFLEIPASKMAERYVELPKDADGEYIRIGDWLTNKQHNGRFRVEAIGGNTKDGMYVVYFRRDDGSLWFYYANQCRHYHAPTVEDVLHELIGKALTVIEINGENELVNEYAAKLRLADGGKEQ